MKVLVTGGAGFIGSNLIRYLLNNRDYQVLDIDKLCFPGSACTNSELSALSNYHFLQLDICEQKDLGAVFEDFQPDAVFHLAAESHVDRSIDSPAPFIQSNIVGTFSLLEVFRKYYSNSDAERKQQLKFIHVSTDEVFGSLSSSAPAFTETHPYNPSSPYSASKAASDHLVRSWHATYDLPLMITNCSNNFGPYQFPEKLMPLIISKALKGEKLPVYGDGGNVRDWLYVQDHVQALCAVLERGTPGETYNIGADSEKSNIEVVTAICDILSEIKPQGFSYHDLVTYVEDRPGHDLRYAIDAGKIRQQTAWIPETPFSDGLRKTVDWYLNNQAWCTTVTADTYTGGRLGLGEK